MLRVRTLAPRLADRLARLAHGLGGHRAGVDDDRVVEPGRRGMAAHHLDLEGVQPAAEGDDLEHAEFYGQDDPPVKLDRGTGPVMTHVIVGAPFDLERAAVSDDLRLARPVSPRRAAATRAAQAPVPQARVRPTPRSHTRSADPSRDQDLRDADIGALGKQRMALEHRPQRRRSSMASTSRHEEHRRADCPC